MALDVFCLGVMKDNKWIIVTVATVGLLAKYDEAKFSEIAHTLEFK
jgi:roadblock/LC7 domain-containing protein